MQILASRYISLLCAQVLNETFLAWKIKLQNDKEIWFPKSRCMLLYYGFPTKCNVLVPDWLILKMQRTGELQWTYAGK